jgi:hypothetical protein
VVESPALSSLWLTAVPSKSMVLICACVVVVLLLKREKTSTSCVAPATWASQRHGRCSFLAPSRLRDVNYLMRMSSSWFPARYSSEGTRVSDCAKFACRSIAVVALYNSSLMLRRPCFNRSPELKVKISSYEIGIFSVRIKYLEGVLKVLTTFMMDCILRSSDLNWLD